MLRLAFLLSVASASQLLASADCDTAAARWVEITPPKVEEALGQPMSAAVQEVGRRWGFAASSYIGASIVIENGKPDLDTAEAMLVTDTLIDCWVAETESISAENKAMIAEFEALFTSERRSTLRNAAEAIMKGEN